MRILQLIDSLEAGGAERMAVNYANMLSEEGAFSVLVTTRKEGVLKAKIAPKVAYLFLNKKRTLDFSAVFRLRKFIKQHRIQCVQAHSSSFFLAVMVKCSYPKLKIIWHDHYGNSDFLIQRPKAVLQCLSFLFDGIISVNEKLQKWALDHLHCKNSVYLSNFVCDEREEALQSDCKLKGISGKRIVCLANLRPQKNHSFLLELASLLKESHPDWSFHLVGKDFKDAYSVQLKKEIKERQLENQVFLYDSCSDVEGVLKQAEIGILTSKSEGLPLAVLEYARHKKAVVLTNVGQLQTVVDTGENGFLVPPDEVVLFYKQLIQLINQPELRASFAEKLHQKVEKQFSAAAVIKAYSHWVSTTIINE
ncbi:putative alpha-glycosyltransferase Glycosyltransferase family 4 [Flavobacterium daejeonense]|nr:putative alpha-glycosyltransferase Glycosyltransferase family 4 [Flavobacterium daejeonense]